MKNQDQRDPAKKGNKRQKASSADRLTRTTKDGGIELNEEQLERAAGGASCATGQHIKKASFEV
jgi:hypothetical protein